MVPFLCIRRDCRSLCCVVEMLWISPVYLPSRRLLYFVTTFPWNIVSCHSLEAIMADKNDVFAVASV